MSEKLLSAEALAPPDDPLAVPKRPEFLVCKYFAVRFIDLFWSLLPEAEASDGTTRPPCLRISQKGQAKPVYYSGIEAYEIYEELMDEGLAPEPNPFNESRDDRRRI